MRFLVFCLGLAFASTSPSISFAGQTAGGGGSWPGNGLSQGGGSWPGKSISLQSSGSTGGSLLSLGSSGSTSGGSNGGVGIVVDATLPCPNQYTITKSGSGVHVELTKSAAEADATNFSCANDDAIREVLSTHIMDPAHTSEFCGLAILHRFTSQGCQEYSSRDPATGDELFHTLRIPLTFECVQCAGTSCQIPDPSSALNQMMYPYYVQYSRMKQRLANGENLMPWEIYDPGSVSLDRSGWLVSKNRENSGADHIFFNDTQKFDPAIVAPQLPIEKRNLAEYKGFKFSNDGLTLKMQGISNGQFRPFNGHDGGGGNGMFGPVVRRNLNSVLNLHGIFAFVSPWYNPNGPYKKELFHRNICIADAASEGALFDSNFWLGYSVIPEGATRSRFCFPFPQGFQIEKGKAYNMRLSITHGTGSEASNDFFSAYIEPVDVTLSNIAGSNMPLFSQRFEGINVLDQIAGETSWNAGIVSIEAGDEGNWFKGFQACDREDPALAFVSHGNGDESNARTETFEFQYIGTQSLPSATCSLDTYQLTGRDVNENPVYKRLAAAQVFTVSNGNTVSAQPIAMPPTTRDKSIIVRAELNCQVYDQNNKPMRMIQSLLYLKR